METGGLPGRLLAPFLRHAPSLDFIFWALTSPTAAVGEQEVFKQAAE